MKLNIYYKPMEELMKMLECHEINFVLAFRSSQRYAGIKSHVLFNNHLAAIVNKHHLLAKRNKVTLAEIEKYDIALPAYGLQARNAYRKHSAQQLIRLLSESDTMRKHIHAWI